MKKTPMPLVAGILNLVSGGLSAIAFVGLLIASIAVGCTAVDIVGWIPGMGIALGVLIVLTVVSLVVGILALVGGVFAVQRKYWGWALAGSICALVPLFVLGVAAIVLTSLSTDEFEQP